MPVFGWKVKKAPPGPRASRPHNTGKGSPLSSTWLDRQRRQDSASAEPRRFSVAGWPAAISRGIRAARNGSACGRDARAPGGLPHRGESERLATVVHAGETPALPEGCRIAGNPSGTLRECMRAGRPRSRRAAASRGIRAARNGSACGRDARAPGGLPHRGESERHATGVHAGGTPALPARLFRVASWIPLFFSREKLAFPALGWRRCSG